MKTGVLGMLFAKVERVSSNVSKGAVMTLMSTDAHRPYELADENIHFLWSAPLILILTIILASRILGVAVLPGLGVAVVVAYVNRRSIDIYAVVEDKLMKCQQTRLQKLAEFLEGILVVKFFSWEHGVVSSVTAARDQELACVKKRAYCIAAVMTVVLSASTIMSVASFATYAALGHELTAEVVFPAMYLFDLVTMPMIVFPNIISCIASARVSFARLAVRAVVIVCQFCCAV